MGCLWSQSAISTFHVILIIERTMKRILLVHREDRISQKLAPDIAFLVQMRDGLGAIKVIEPIFFWVKIEHYQYLLILEASDAL